MSQRAVGSKVRVIGNSAHSQNRSGQVGEVAAVFGPLNLEGKPKGSDLIYEVFFKHEEDFQFFSEEDLADL